jgi:hypothetical protein
MSEMNTELRDLVERAERGPSWEATAAQIVRLTGATSKEGAQQALGISRDTLHALLHGTCKPSVLRAAAARVDREVEVRLEPLEHHDNEVNHAQ